MALQIKSDVSLNATGSLCYIEFLNATGTYDEDDNPGGFGPPNPSRNILAFFLVALHQAVEADIPFDIFPYNPITVTSFTLNVTRELNGVLKYSILGIPIFVEGNTYQDGDVVYDNTNITAPFIKERVAGEWVETTAEQVIGNASVPQLNDYGFIINEAIRYSNLLLKVKQLLLRPFVYGGCEDCQRDKFETANDRYNYVSGLIITADNEFCRQAYNEAQSMLEEVFKIQDLYPNG